jgi:hypothetical protein
MSVEAQVKRSRLLNHIAMTDKNPLDTVTELIDCQLLDVRREPRLRRRCVFQPKSDPQGIVFQFHAADQFNAPRGLWKRWRISWPPSCRNCSLQQLTGEPGRRLHPSTHAKAAEVELLLGVQKADGRVQQAALADTAEHVLAPSTCTLPNNQVRRTSGGWRFALRRLTDDQWARPRRLVESRILGRTGVHSLQADLLARAGSNLRLTVFPFLGRRESLEPLRPLAFRRIKEPLARNVTPSPSRRRDGVADRNLIGAACGSASGYSTQAVPTWPSNHGGWIPSTSCAASPSRWPFWKLIEPRLPSAAPVQPTGIVCGSWPKTVTTARRTGTCSRASVRSPLSGSGSQAIAAAAFGGGGSFVSKTRIGWTTRCCPCHEKVAYA